MREVKRREDINVGDFLYRRCGKGRERDDRIIKVERYDVQDDTFRGKCIRGYHKYNFILYDFYKEYGRKLYILDKPWDFMLIDL